ncbi:MAG: hypothetical protein R6U91_06980 [Bacillota bacterium]
MEIRNRRDSQGIVLRGKPFALGVVVKLLKDNFFDFICREKEAGNDNLVDDL